MILYSYAFRLVPGLNWWKDRYAFAAVSWTRSSASLGLRVIHSAAGYSCADSVGAHIVLGAGDQHILDAVEGHLPNSVWPITTIAGRREPGGLDERLSAAIGAALAATWPRSSTPSAAGGSKPTPTFRVDNGGCASEKRGAAVERVVVSCQRLTSQVILSTCDDL